MSVELPDSYESIYAEAITQMSVGNSQRAIESLTRMVNRLCRLRPETLERKENLRAILSEAWNSLVEFLRWEGRFDEAIEVCRCVSGRLPAHQVRQRIGALIIESGEMEQGLAEMRAAAEESGSFEAWADIAAAYSAVNQYQLSIQASRGALALATSNEQAALINLGLIRVYQQTGQTAEMLDAWNMAIVLDPALAEHAAQVYSWLIDRGEFELAARYIERDTSRVRSAFYSGLIEARNGRSQTAREQWQRVLAMNVHDEYSEIEAWMQAALRLGQPDRALTQVQELDASARATSLELMVLHAASCFNTDKQDKGMELLRKAVTRVKRSWPSRPALSAQTWQLFTELVTDPAAQERAATCFER